MNKTKKFKTLFLTILAIFFIGVGFLNFNIEKDSFDIAYDNQNKTGDIQLVSSETTETENTVNNEVIENEPDYFSESRIDRDNRYSQMLETYQKMIDSNDISSDQKGIAIEEVKKIEKEKNGILISENLIKNKGFEDVVIFINDSSVSVIVKSNVTLLKEQVAQIQNIISRELDVKIENINITNH